MENNFSFEKFYFKNFKFNINFIKNNFNPELKSIEIVMFPDYSDYRESSTIECFALEISLLLLGNLIFFKIENFLLSAISRSWIMGAYRLL